MFVVLKSYVKERSISPILELIQPDEGAAMLSNTSLPLDSPSHAAKA